MYIKDSVKRITMLYTKEAITLLMQISNVCLFVVVVVFLKFHINIILIFYMFYVYR